MLLFAFTPGICMYGAGVFLIRYFGPYMIFWGLIYVLSLSVLPMENTLGKVCGSIVRHNRSVYFSVIFYSIALLHVFVILYVFLYYVRGDFLMPSVLYANLEAIYERRAFAATLNLPSLISYLLGSACISNIMLVFSFIERRKFIGCICVLFLQWMLFSIDGSKSYFFSMAFCIIFYFLADYLSQRKVIVGSLFIIILAIVANICSNTLVGIGYLRRFLMTPNLLSYDYYTFFDIHVPIYFGLNGEYNGRLAFIIGEVFFNHPTECANNGLLGDAVANFGLVGILAWPITFIVFLLFFDRASFGLNRRMLLGLAFGVMVTLQNTFLATSILSHGILVLMMMMVTFPRKQSRDYII